MVSAGTLTISGAPAPSVNVGSAYKFVPTVANPNGGSLTFSIQNKPSWAIFSSANGQLSGTPAAAAAGTYSGIVISVTDGTQTSSLSAFSIKVVSPGTLTISGTPAASVNVGSAYSFVPTVANPNGGSLTFSIQNKPSWATFTSANGQLSGTPAAASAGTYSGIVISVTDGTSTATLPTFSITVNQASNGTATLDWTSVTQNTNGTAVTVAGYYIYYGSSAGSMTKTIQVTNPTVTSYVVSNLSSEPGISE